MTDQNMILLNTKWPTGTGKLENWPKLENAMDFSLAIRMCTRKAVLQALTRWDERVYKLHDVFNEENRCLEYEYDFGTSWNHAYNSKDKKKTSAKTENFHRVLTEEGRIGWKIAKTKPRTESSNQVSKERSLT